MPKEKNDSRLFPPIPLHVVIPLARERVLSFYQRSSPSSHPKEELGYKSMVFPISFPREFGFTWNLLTYTPTGSLIAVGKVRPVPSPRINFSMMSR